MKKLTEQAAREMGLRIKKTPNHDDEIVVNTPKIERRPATSKQDMQLMALRVSEWKS